MPIENEQETTENEQETTENEQETTENEQQTIENEGNETTNELLELKKKLAEDIADKLEISESVKGLVIDYLVEEGEKNSLGLKDYEGIKDTVGDKVIERIFGSLGIITSQLIEFREDINKQTTKEGLEELKEKIFKKIGGENQESEESTDSSTSSTTVAGSATGTSAGVGTLTNDSKNNSTKEGNKSGTTSEKAKVDTSSQSYEIDHFNITVSPKYKEMWNNLKGKKKPDLEPFACGMKAFESQKNKINNKTYIAIVDFTKKRGTKRFFVINLETNTVEDAVKVGHGKNSGGERAKQFSNIGGSNKSSLGGYILPDEITISPSKGWPGLRNIEGVESSNNQSDERHIAVHGGGERGSQGCFTIPTNVSKSIMEKIKGGFLFAYAKSKNYFAQSQFFQKNPDGSYTA